jgi:ABC-type uncharacterized transport system permease subunit
VDVTHLASNLALLGYAVASVLYLVTVPGRNASGSPAWAARAAVTVFALSTAGATVAAVTALGEHTTLDSAGYLLTALIGVLALAGHTLFRLRLVGAFVAPLATLLLLAQFFVASKHGGDSTPTSAFIGAHVLVAVAGQAFAVMACAISVLYLWQRTLLKKKLLDQLPASLPAIDRLDFLLMTSLWTGFILITLGLLSGAAYVQLYVAPPELRLGAKVAWATLVWLWYLATLLARNVFRQPGKRVAQMSLAGFLLLAFTYFGMGFLRPMVGG